MMHNSSKSKHVVATFLTLAAATMAANAEVKLPRFISSSMVLQRGDTAQVWGKAEPGEQVTVTFLKKRFNTVADAEGKWQVGIPTTQKKMVGGPYKLTIDGSQTESTITLDDIWVGDVWLCTGQSNMDLHTARLVDLYKDEFDSDSNPAIHLMQTARQPMVGDPQDDVDPNGFYAWEPMKPENVGHWSGVSYFFAKEMYQKTGVPQGIMNVSMGGCDIIAYMRREVVEQINPRYIQQIDHLAQPGYLQRNGQLSAVIGRTYNEIQDKNDPGLNGNWMAEQLDDSDWEVVNQYDAHIGDTDGRTWTGTLWFRKEFDVPADLVGQDSLLRLGCMIDADVCYVNGQRVGNITYQYPPRKYTLPQGLIKAGRNVVCIRLQTNGSAEKFVKEKPYKLFFHGGKNIDLEGDWKMKRGVLMPRQPGVEGVNNSCAASLYNNTIAPLSKTRIAGIIWYQGESNAGKPEEYAKMLPAMISDWRETFGQVPAVICGLANFMERHPDANYNGGWAKLRESQRKSVNKLDNAGLVVTLDLGEWNDIHPLNKKDVAHRCALWMESLRFGKKQVTEGPAYESVRFEAGRAILSFREGTNDLCTAPAVLPTTMHFTKEAPVNADGSLKGFSVAGADGRWHWAEARIEGKQVIVTSPEVKEPKKVRYAWDDDPFVSLFNTSGLPAASFCTE